MYILIIAVEQVNIRDFRETYRYIFTAIGRHVWPNISAFISDGKDSSRSFLYYVSSQVATSGKWYKVET